MIMGERRSGVPNKPNHLEDVAVKMHEARKVFSHLHLGTFLSITDVLLQQQILLLKTHSGSNIEN